MAARMMRPLMRFVQKSGILPTGIKEVKVQRNFSNACGQEKKEDSCKKDECKKEEKKDECKKDECEKEECCTQPHPMAAEVLGVPGAEPIPCCTPESCATFEHGEVKFFYNQFIKYDGDKDGKLTRWELNELYREKYGRMLNSSDLERMLREMGLQYCDNLIGFTEYMSHLQKRYSPAYCLQELIQVFDMWDKNSDGRLDWFEFKLAIGFLGFDPDHPDLLCRFQTSDRDYDDMLEFDEFVESYEALPDLPKRCLE